MLFFFHFFVSNHQLKPLNAGVVITGKRYYSVIYQMVVPPALLQLIYCTFILSYTSEFRKVTILATIMKAN
jgi:hypothetical protein